MSPQTANKIASIKSFQGYYARGSNDDCPQDHFTLCNNCVFSGADVACREGFSVLYSANHSVAAFFVYSASVRTVPTNPFVYPMIYMDNGGNLYDAGQNPNVLLTAFGSSANDFAAIEAFGKIFITPKALGYALPGNFTYYWDGTNFAKLAGVGPVAGPTLAQANPGVVDAGVHGVAISYLYRTGYLSPPSPVTNITSIGTQDIEVSVIPLGGANVVGRVVLMTLANQTELFFVPVGTINDNVTTTFVINNHDSDLLASADYLNDVLTTVPSCSSIRFYKGRLVFIGCSDFPFIIKLSDVGIYDSTNNIGNIINIPRDNITNSPSTGLVISNVLYILKPYGTYALQDNSGDPDTWDVTVVDSGLGAFDTATSLFSSGLSGQDVLDTSFVVHPRGLLLFNGNYSDPPLSFKIDTYWQNNSVGLFPYVKIANDIIGKRLYIVPFNGVCLMMDYSYGLTPDTVRWSVWTVTYNMPFIKSVSVALDQTGKYVPIFSMAAFGVMDPNVYTITAGQTYDVTSSYQIGQVINSALLHDKDEGVITCFTGLRLRITGTGYLGIAYMNEDGGNLYAPRVPNLSTYTGVDFFTGTNYTNEKVIIELTANTGGFTLKRLDLFGNKQWNVRPALTQST